MAAKIVIISYPYINYFTYFTHPMLNHFKKHPFNPRVEANKRNRMQKGVHQSRLSFQTRFAYPFPSVPNAEKLHKPHDKFRATAYTPFIKRTIIIIIISRFQTHRTAHRAFVTHLLRNPACNATPRLLEPFARLVTC